MARYIEPKTLLKLANEAISKILVGKCKSLEKYYKIRYKEQHLTYDNPGCAASVEMFHNELLAVFATLPVVLCNGICEAALARNENLKRKFKIQDMRILYGVLVNEMVTRLYVRFGEEIGGSQFTIEHVIPQMKNMIELNLKDVSSDEIVSEISRTCKKLEFITVQIPMSPETLRSFATNCPGLRQIISYGYQPKETMILAFTMLPNLEIMNWLGTGEALLSASTLAPIKLRVVHEREATPANILAAVTLCPQLQELRVLPSSEVGSRDILDILATSTVRLTSLNMTGFDLSGGNTDRYFQEKGRYLKDIEIFQCKINHPFDFIKLIGIYCKNLQKLRLVDFDPSTEFTVNEDMPPKEECLFQSLRVLCITIYYCDDPMLSDPNIFSTRVEKVTKFFGYLLANAPSLETISIGPSSIWELGSGISSTDEDIEKLFPVGRMTKLRSLDVRRLVMTERMASYFLKNTPCLTNFTVPFGVTSSAVDYIMQMRQEYRMNNRNLKFKFTREHDDPDYEEEYSNDDSETDQELEIFGYSGDEDWYDEGWYNDSTEDDSFEDGNFETGFEDGNVETDSDDDYQ